MSDAPPPKPRSSCLGKLLALFSIAGIGGLGVAVWFVWQAQDLSDIKGIGAGADGKSARNLKAVLKSSVDRAYPVTLSEEEINLYLRQTLEAKHEGFLAEEQELRGVYVRLKDGQAEIIMERAVFGRPITVSMYLRIEQSETMQGIERTVLRDGGEFFAEAPRLKRGGRFGRLVVPQGFLLLVLPSFEKLAEVYREEISEGIEEMARITIEEDKLVLDPRPDGGQSSLEGF